MRYIIEDALTLFYGKEERNSYFIEDSKVLYKSNHFTQYKQMRLNTEQFVVAPGHVMIDFGIVHINEFQSFKGRMKYLQSLGCTTFISACEIHYESELSIRLKKAKHALINSSIDYVVGVKIPLKKLSATLVRKCCKYKVPIIFTEVNEITDLYSVEWQWVRDELFPYQLLIIPVWNIEVSTRRLNRLKSEWVELLKANKINTHATLPKEHTPLSKQFLLNIGLYPNKGSLQTNCDADYLLFLKEKFIKNKTDFQTTRPQVVYANGALKVAGETIYMHPGTGRDLEIRVPKKHVPISEAFEPPSILIDYY